MYTKFKNMSLFSMSYIHLYKKINHLEILCLTQLKRKIRIFLCLNCSFVLIHIFDNYRHIWLLLLYTLSYNERTGQRLPISSHNYHSVYIDFAGGSGIKRLPTMWETWVQSLGWEDLLEKAMAAHSCILAWKIPWMEEPGRLQSMGSQRVGHDWATSLSLSHSLSRE